MNNTVLNGLQLYTKKTAAGLSDEQMLTHLLMTKPHQVSTLLSHIFGGYKGQQVQVLDFITKGMGNVKTIPLSNTEYTWNLDIDIDRAIPILKSEWNGSSITSTDTPGLNNTPIVIWVPEKFFGPGAIISFDNRDYQARVQFEGEPDGEMYRYVLVTANGDPSRYIDPDMFTSGRKVSRLGSAYEEGSEQADIVNYSSPFMMKNKLTTLRLNWGVTRTAATDKLIIEYTDPQTGRKSQMWEDYQNWKGLRQWYEMKDFMAVYSQYNTTPQGTVNVKGSTNRPVHIGAGLLEQVSPANTRQYTKMSSGLIEDFLSDLSYNKLGFGERRFLGLAGEMGMRQMHYLLAEKAAAYTLVDTKFVTGDGQNLTFGGQFRTWKMLNGIELTLMHFPWLDNKTHNRILDPVYGRPVTSWDILFFDISPRDGKSNIVKCIKEKSENLMWYTGGSIAPGSDVAKSMNTLRSNSGDGYTINLLSEEGIMLEDPTTSGWLRYNVEQ